MNKISIIEMKLFHGDCLEEIKNIDDNSVDLIFCDLPYGQLPNCKWDIIIPWKPFWKEIMRVKKLNTPIFFTSTTKFGVELINNAPKKCPFRFDLVWIKSASTGFLTSKIMPLKRHEMVYAFYEKKPFYNLSSHQHKFNQHSTDKSTVSYASVYNNSNKTTTPTTKHPVKGETTGQPRYDPPLPDSLLEIKSTRGKHPTEKPVALMEWILKYYSKEGDVVLDPTMGSGSTGVACKNMNREFIGIEKDAGIYQVAVNRLDFEFSLNE
jgi:DNA modification methylase